MLPNLSVAENLLFDREPGRFGWLGRSAMHDEARAVLSRIGIDLDPRRACGSLSISEQQLVEIAKGVSTDASVFFFDEPTAPLNRAEADKLEALIHALKAEGKLIFCISHRLDEIFRLCDTVTVLKDGQWIEPVDEALVELQNSCSQIYMTGLSMGGTLTLFTAAGHAAMIKGAIPINAVVQIGKPDMAGLAFGRGLPETVPGIGSDVKDPGSKELAYPVVPVPAFRQVNALAAVTHDLLPRIKCPTLVIQSREDHVVDPSNGPRIVGLLGSSRVELVWLENSHHVATIDHDKDLIAQLTIDFIASIAGR